MSFVQKRYLSNYHHCYTVNSINHNHSQSSSLQPSTIAIQPQNAANNRVYGVYKQSKRNHLKSQWKDYQNGNEINQWIFLMTKKMVYRISALIILSSIWIIMAFKTSYYMYAISLL